MLPTIRHGARPAPRRRPGTAPRRDRAVDRVLGVSRRRRHAGYIAIAAGLGLLRPMLRRVAVATGGFGVALVVIVTVRFVL